MQFEPARYILFLRGPLLSGKQNGVRLNQVIALGEQT